MDKNIEQIVLKICHDREIERLKTLEKNFIDLIQSKFNECLKTFSPWKGVGMNPVIIHEISRYFSRRDCDYITKQLGFIIHYQPLSAGVSIPEWDCVSTPTYAQNMLINFNSQLKDSIKNEENKLSEVCESIYDKLTSGNFKYSKSTNYYTITVEFDFSHASKIVETGLIKSLHSFNFYNVEISNCSLKFCVKEKFL